MMHATYRCKAGLTIKLILHAAHGAVAHKVPYPTAPVALHTRYTGAVCFRVDDDACA